MSEGDIDVLSKSDFAMPTTEIEKAEQTGTEDVWNKSKQEFQRYARRALIPKL